MRQRGFSLIELLLVVAIMGILASVTLVRSDLMRSDAEVNAATQQIVNIAKNTKQQSISVAEYNGIFPSYGLYMEEGSGEIIIYANCIADDNDEEDSFRVVDHLDNFAFNDMAHEGCNEVMDGYYGSDAAKVDVHLLKDGAFVSGIETKDRDEDTKKNNFVSINFLRPEPTVWVTDDDGSVIPAGYVKVTVRDKAGRYERDIIFYTTTLIEVTHRRAGG